MPASGVIVPTAFPALIEPGTMVTVVNAATTTGAQNAFGFTSSPTGVTRTVAYQCTGTYSVCTANLQISMDGGTTWTNIGSTVDLKANPAGNLTTFFSVGNIIGGPLYQFSIASFTGTSITINIAVS